MAGNFTKLSKGNTERIAFKAKVIFNPSIRITFLFNELDGKLESTNAILSP